MNTFDIILYCFGIIIPTIMLLFSYGNFAFRIGEYIIQQSKKEKNLPIMIVLILSKLFVISFVIFYIYHFIFDNSLKENIIGLKIVFWGLLISIDSFIINHELVFACNHASSIQSYKKIVYNKEKQFRKKYKIILWLRNIFIVSIIFLFILNFSNESLSFTLIFLITYIYYNYRIDKYIKSLLVENDK